MTTNMIFVFGSNLAGIHGAGAALFAKKNHGAIQGVGVGRQGDSYGVPTKDRLIQTLPLDEIRKYVDEFIEYANQHPELTFKVTRVGCGLAGYSNLEMAPLFYKAPANCLMDIQWASLLGRAAWE